MDTRRLLLAFLLSLGVILIWYTVFPPPKPAPPRPPVSEERAAPPPETVPPGPVPGTPSAPAATPAVAGAPREQIEAAGEERIVLQQGRTRAVFTNRGAQLVSMLVPEKASPQSGTLELVRKRTGGLYPYALTAARGLQPHPLDQARSEEHTSELQSPC